MSYALAVDRGGEVTVLYTPLPHQLKFHQSTARHCIMEGSRGGGKSKAIRADAYMRSLLIPRHKSLIVRRTMPELRLSHLGEVPFEAQALGLPRDAWHSTHNILRFPNGSVVEFGHVEDELALPRYLSSAFEAIYYDELATFTLRMFSFLNTSARTTIPGLTPVIRGGTNPVGIGASWVKRYFIDHDVPDLIGYEAKNYESIKCNMDDNPYLNRAEYEQQLNALPSEALRRALRHGEWVIEGQFFTEWAPTKDGRPWHVIPRLPLYKDRPIIYAPHIEIVRVIDWGYSATGNPGLCSWFAVLDDGSAIGFREYLFLETLPEDAARHIIEQSKDLRVRYTVGDTAMWAEHLGPSIAEKFAQAGLSMIEADKEREPGWVETHDWLRTEVNDGTGARPKLSYLETGCPHSIRTIPNMVVDPKNPADMQTTGVEDEAADNARYFCMSRPGRSRAPQKSSRVKGLMEMILKHKRQEHALGRENTRRRW